MTPKTASITAVAEAFFEACEAGKGWETCSAYCTPNATFSAQAEPLLDVKTLAQYTDWMKGMPVPPTGRGISTDYVYVMQFEGNRIAHLTKIWNAGLALKDLGWA